MLPLGVQASNSPNSIRDDPHSVPIGVETNSSLCLLPLSPPSSFRDMIDLGLANFDEGITMLIPMGFLVVILCR